MGLISIGATCDKLLYRRCQLLVQACAGAAAYEVPGEDARGHDGVSPLHGCEAEGQQIRFHKALPPITLHILPQFFCDLTIVFVIMHPDVQQISQRLDVCCACWGVQAAGGPVWAAGMGGRGLCARPGARHPSAVRDHRAAAAQRRAPSAQPSMSSKTERLQRYEQSKTNCSDVLLQYEAPWV